MLQFCLCAAVRVHWIYNVSTQRRKIRSLTSAVLIRRENACASTSRIPHSTISMHHTTRRTTTGRRTSPTASRHRNSPRPVSQSPPARPRPSKPKHVRIRLRKTRKRSLYADGTMKSLGKILICISFLRKRLMKYLPDHAIVSLLLSSICTTTLRIIHALWFLQRRPTAHLFVAGRAVRRTPPLVLKIISIVTCRTILDVSTCVP